MPQSLGRPAVVLDVLRAAGIFYFPVHKHQSHLTLSSCIGPPSLCLESDPWLRSNMSSQTFLGLHSTLQDLHELLQPGHVGVPFSQVPADAHDDVGVVV